MVTATATQTTTDEQIQKDVLAELKYDARVQPNEIGVAVKDGTSRSWDGSTPTRRGGRRKRRRIGSAA